MAESLPDEDVAPVADPFEAELVAYLDGELEDGAAKRVETRLATDPQARAKASALKKTFDLLDYLPKPEPSATFTTRTIDKLPVLQGGAPQAKSQASAAVSQSPRQPRNSQPIAAALATSRPNAPVAQSEAALLLSPKPDRTRRLIWAAGILVAVVGCATAGYFGGAAIRSKQTASRTGPSKETQEELTVSDHRLIENLPYYVVVDDYDFLNELAKPELIGDDPAVSYDSAFKVPSLPPEQPTGTVFMNLEKAFLQLSPVRQQAIRELDKQLYADPPVQRDRLFRVMEAYAVWLNNLPDSERSRILAASTADSRLKLIGELRKKQWIDSLPPSQRIQLSSANGELNMKLAEEWRAREIHQQEEWRQARKHPEMLDGSKVPWPFENEAIRAEIIDFAKMAFRLDDGKDGKGSRLAANDQERYTAALNFALQQGGSAWHIYGRTLYELIKKQEEFLLPPPADPAKRYTDIPDLPEQQKKFANQQQVKMKLAAYVGKWPEFPLEVHKDFLLYHKVTKSDLKYNSPPLGPARSSEFTPKVREFVETKVLTLKLSDQDRKRLQYSEGKWPEYPREIMQLAREHNLSIPGVMLPGPPKQWEAMYGPNRLYK